MNGLLFSSDKVFSVSELNNLLRELLEQTFPKLIIEGELSNCKVSNGHLYFTLKDQDAQISAIMFAGNARYLSFRPVDGLKVQCTGKLSVYPARGNYQIIVTKMEVAGEGAILKMLEERKRKLSMEGLFEQSRKRTLPLVPKTVGIVTSPTGAALRDILQITKRRNKAVSVIVFPALVQGAEAASSIERQIKIANDFDLCDVLIVGRGGGSLEDLLPFSEENVVRAIAASRIPVVSAVGHEIDWALSDFAADKRAPTPSAAAEIVVPEQTAILDGLTAYKKEFFTTISQKVEKIKLTIRSFNPENLELNFRHIEQPLLIRFDNAKENLVQNMEQRLKDLRQKLANSITILESASPQSILDRGYSMVRDAQTKQIIRSADQVCAGSTIEILPSSGIITATVENTKSAQ